MIFSTIAFCTFSFWGAAVGSFLNVVIYRLPRGFLLTLPRRSYCLSCLRQIHWYENIPIFGYVFLRGRCRNCHEKIGARHPMVEVLTALLFGAIGMNYGFNVHAIYLAAFAAALLAITFIDFDFRIIPDMISWPMMVIGLLGASVIPGLEFKDAFWGGLLGGGLFWSMASAYLRVTGRDGLGFGDVKMLAMIGTFLGVSGVLGTIMISSVIGSAVGLTLMLKRGQNMKMALPYGPFLAVGAFCMIFWGDTIRFILLSGM